MSAASRTLSLDQAIPGSVLAADLLDAHGALLLPAGTTLSESLLASLAQRGIEQLDLRHDSPAESEAEATARRQRLVSRIEYLFRAAGDNIAMRELQSQITSFRLGRAP